ncbi:hypothetical protein CHELA41_21511 [Hyphomicrobiales bacterium]|nr:hypothetical protein CHELA41_21511 [Hyphomicrobiales bacterium]
MLAVTINVDAFLRVLSCRSRLTLFIRPLLARSSLNRLCLNGNRRDPRKEGECYKPRFSFALTRARGQCQGCEESRLQHRCRRSAGGSRARTAQKKRPAFNAGLFEVRYSLRVAKWPGIPLTPGGWGADVFRHQEMPSHQGNMDFIAGQLGRRWASLRRKCGFCDLSNAATQHG